MIERRLNPALQPLQCADLVVEHLRSYFDLDFHLIQALRAGQYNLVMRQRALDLEQRGLHLRWEDIDAANNQHVVAAAADAGNPAIVRPHSQGPAGSW